MSPFDLQECSEAALFKDRAVWLFHSDLSTKWHQQHVQDVPAVLHPMDPRNKKPRAQVADDPRGIRLISLTKFNKF